MPDSELTVVFAAGGTGGGIFPALAIAEELRGLHPAISTPFLASQRAIDASILNAARVPWTPIRARPFCRKPRAR